MNGFDLYVNLLCFGYSKIHMCLVYDVTRVYSLSQTSGVVDPVSLLSSLRRVVPVRSERGNKD